MGYRAYTSFGQNSVAFSETPGACLSAGERLRHPLGLPHLLFCWPKPSLAGPCNFRTFLLHVWSLWAFMPWCAQANSWMCNTKTLRSLRLVVLYLSPNPSLDCDRGQRKPLLCVITLRCNCFIHGRPYMPLVSVISYGFNLRSASGTSSDNIWNSSKYPILISNLIAFVGEEQLFSFNRDFPWRLLF